MAAGTLPIARGIALDQDDRARAAIIMGIMTTYKVNVADVADAFGVALDPLRASYNSSGRAGG